jgi:hypothetical protein
MGIFDVFGGVGQEIQALENVITSYENGIQTGTQPAGSGGGGNGYRFTPDEMQGVLSDWKNLRAQIDGAKQNAEPMVSTVAPGKESASDTAISGVNQSGNAYMDHLNAMGTYAEKYIAALSGALTNYQNAEESGHSAMTSVQTQL